MYLRFLFSAMDALDGDGQALASKGRMALRDIVQVGICPYIWALVMKLIPIHYSAYPSILNSDNSIFDKPTCYTI